MKYLERAFTGFGLAFLLIIAWWYFIGFNESLQYCYNYNISSSYFSVVIIAVVIIAVFTISKFNLTDFLVMVTVVVIIAALVGVVGVVALVNFSIGEAISSFVILSVLFLIEIYIVNQIKSKKSESSYWLTYVILVVVFAAGIHFTTIALEYNAFKKMESMQKTLIYMYIKDNNIYVPVESKMEGCNLAKHLYYESIFADSVMRHPVKIDIELDDIEHFSNSDTSYYNLIFAKDSTQSELWLFSYNKKKKIM